MIVASCSSNPIGKQEVREITVPQTSMSKKLGCDALISAFPRLKSTTVQAPKRRHVITKHELMAHVVATMASGR